jgi:hypothetical protein
VVQHYWNALPSVVASYLLGVAGILVQPSFYLLFTAMATSATRQPDPLLEASRMQVSWRWPTLLILLLLHLWAAHALAFFAHEYAHSFTAWLLGWKANPFDLHFPAASPLVWLLQLGINQQVDEGPIFASGHGPDAAFIGAAGMLLGNALLSLSLSRLLWRWASRRQRAGWALFAYWGTVASLGNLLDYVPIRTFTREGDMGTLQRGLDCSPWVVLLVLGLPTFGALWWFFARVLPAALTWLFPRNRAQRGLVSALTVGALCGFYGAVGFLEGGPVAERLSWFSVYVVLPALLLLELMRLRRAAPVSAAVTA